MCWATERNIEVLTQAGQSHLSFYEHRISNVVPPLTSSNLQPSP